jgi:hypothetical protein
MHDISRRRLRDAAAAAAATRGGVRPLGGARPLPRNICPAIGDSLFTASVVDATAITADQQIIGSD